jgi:hypothetical protein
MKPHTPIPPGFSPSPIFITLRPGQVLTIVGTDSSGNVPPGGVVPPGAGTIVGQGRQSDSPRKSPDSPRKSPDSPRKSPDSPRKSPDASRP